ncbi:MAG: Signal transduction histidine kinase containing PAS domain [Candidatus Methanohalarchaeum thermophilum]|uniref:histidine kinase n=1 Tax=Methanohalarchaeum thermophilum TaxID=1903181 RepID=A0A1Q6DWU3_METT1|nr:MAG: Signal transduction histidine kinase containing PAS domain [Candidatus Methanohalarchaeum thermophilum]
MVIGRKTVFEEVNNPIIVLDKGEKIIDINKSGEKLIKQLKNINKVIGKNITEVSPEKFNFLKEVNAQEKSIHEFKAKIDEETRYFESQLHPLKDNKKNQIGWTIITTDITRRKEMQKQEEFLHSLLRHDVRNKNQITKGYLQLLKEKDLNKEIRGKVDKAIDALSESEDIIKKVRTLKEIQEQKIKEIDLENVIQEVIEENQSRIKEKNIEIIKNPKKFKTKVKGGPLLKELFDNLINNSIKHSGGNKIRINCRKKPKKVICSIEDDGKGIPKEVKDKIFERGYKQGETGKTGIGLYLVKEIIEKYNGKIEVKDSELGGARFDVTLKKT